ncbi:MAG: hypothetical protein JNJ41_06135 [Bacteroidia bacterium]|nr:hypothetical protein [Bacteroidia bacterium]
MIEETILGNNYKGKLKLRINLLLLGFVIVLFFLNAYNSVINKRPTIVHQWRQTDCLSITKNYYEEGMDFFNPKIHFQGNLNGKAVSEFPILNYTVAALWKVFGEHEFIYKLLEYFLFILCIFILFNTLLKFTNSAMFSFFIVSLLLTSPLLAYYSFNYLADVPALSLAIMGFSFLTSFYHTRSMKFFYWCLFVSTLAVLIKASAVLPFALLLFFSLIDIFNLNRVFKTEKLFSRKTIPSVTIVLSVIAVLAWYKYAVDYNKSANSVFLLTVLPIWEMTESAILNNLQVLFNVMFPVFFSKPMFFLFFIAVVFVYSNFKKLNIFFRYSMVFSTLSFIFYLLFFFQVFNAHDYYLNNLMIFPVVTFFCVGNIIVKTEFNINYKTFFSSAVIVLTILNSFYSAAVVRSRTIEDDKLCAWYPFLSMEDKGLAKYLNWRYNSSIGPLETITPELRAIGIKRDDLTLSIPDDSFDVSLYLMDQKGYTVPRDKFVADSSIIKTFVARKMKYLVFNDPSLKNELSYKAINNYFKLIYKKAHVEVFKLKE